MAAKTLAAAALLLPLLQGCPFLSAPETTLARGIPCSAGPILLEPTDQLGDRSARQIDKLNLTGARVCGWRPPAE